jgi:alpha-amylase/alpha-mannosidase (GH57 family)
MLQEHHVKITVNINTILLDLFYEFNLEDTVELLKNLILENKIEIVGSAKFHPIIPLLPKNETENQIRLNEKDIRKLNPNWERKGFFPPELSISSKTAKFIRELGYKWVMVSGSSCPIDWPYEEIYSSPNGLQLFFRDDILSNKISFHNITPKEFVKTLGNIFKPNKNDRYILTAQDSETFGWHHKKYERTFLSRTFGLIEEQENIEIAFISELDKFFPVAEKRIIPKDSSWSTSSFDLKNNNPYPLWKDPDNSLHRLYWKMIRSVNNLMKLLEEIEISKEWETENYYNTARWFYERGTCSDTTWWANPDKGLWSPNLIYRGIELLVKSAFNAQQALIYAEKSDLGEGYFDSVSYYHNLILMEMNNIAIKELKKKKRQDVDSMTN